MNKKQDLNGYRTPEDVARRYKLGDIELNTEDIEELKQASIIDTSLSTTSEHAVENKVITQALNNKVAKETGKGLSSNDYTDTDKNKLSGIESGAEVNIIESVSLNGSTQTITNKNVDISIPNATASNVGGFKVYWDSTNKVLYLTNNNNDPTPSP